MPDGREGANVSAVVTDAVRAIISADPEYRAEVTQAPPLKNLEEAVATIRRLRVACDYSAALRLVPDTVAGLHSRLNTRDWRQALRLLILLEEAAASIVRYLGTPQASVIVAERMREAARRLEEPLMIALAAFQRSHAASSSGAYTYARTVAANAVRDFSPSSTVAGGKELLGMLMLTTAFACYGDGARDDASGYLEEARRIARQTGDTMSLSLFFGPTNVQIWQISIETDGGDPARAVALARRTNPLDVPQIQRQATYYIDTGRALAYLNRDDEAIRLLMESERLAPAHVRSDPIVWETVRDIVERRQRNSVAPDLRAFCGRLGVAL
jgi:hypothetical protein